MLYENGQTIPDIISEASTALAIHRDGKLAIQLLDYFDNHVVLTLKEAELVQSALNNERLQQNDEIRALREKILYAVETINQYNEW